MIYKANQKIIRNEECNEEFIDFLISYWNNVADNINEWQEVMSRELTKKDLRENYIITLAITLTALGKLGRHFYENKDIDMTTYLIRLKEIDWSRTNYDNWLGRTIRENGKVMNSEEAITLTCAKIKQLIGVPLTKDELAKETQR
jgi:DNA sulfur modification protein DndB